MNFYELKYQYSCNRGEWFLLTAKINSSLKTQKDTYTLLMYEERPGPRNCTWSNYLGGLRGQIGFFVLLLMVTNGLWLCDNSQVSTWKGQINNSFSPTRLFSSCYIIIIGQHSTQFTYFLFLHLVVFGLPLLKKYSLTYLNCLKNLASDTILF